MSERKTLPAKKPVLAAWSVVLAGFAGAAISLRALHQGNQAPGLLPVMAVLIPYLAGGMLLHITRKARVVIFALLLPALFDIGAACAYSFGADAGWDMELKWRLLRVGVFGLVVMPLGLGAGLWLDRYDTQQAE